MPGAPDDHGRPWLLLVTGMSGAGKSTVLDALEDMGWDCVDNLPAELIEDFVAAGEASQRRSSVAVGMDVRSRGFDPRALPERIRSVPGFRAEILYLDCATSELIRRYSETRRRHPLASDRPAEDGIAEERKATAELHAAADSVLDTTGLTPTELRDELRRHFGGPAGKPVLTITSFAFSRGVARSADLLFDMRFLDNPHWVDELRPLTGEDPRVRDYIARDEAWAGALDRLEELLKDWIPRYWAAGKSYLTVAFGCTGGRHRSVCAAVEMAERLRRAGFSPIVRHRELASASNDATEGHPVKSASGGSGSELNE